MVPSEPPGGEGPILNVHSFTESGSPGRSCGAPQSGTLPSCRKKPQGFLTIAVSLVDPKLGFGDRAGSPCYWALSPGTRESQGLKVGFWLQRPRRGSNAPLFSESLLPPNGFYYFPRLHLCMITAFSSDSGHISPHYFQR